MHQRCEVKLVNMLVIAVVKAMFFSNLMHVFSKFNIYSGLANQIIITVNSIFKLQYYFI